MCGRFAFTTLLDAITELYKLKCVHAVFDSPRYNIAPSQDIPVVRIAKGSEGEMRGEVMRELVPMHWGLIPSWSKDATSGARMINARSETAATKPAYRAPFKRRRALVPATGYYEWKMPSEQEGGGKQPMYFHRYDDRPFAFAALWDSWRAKDAIDDVPSIQSVTILTCAANEQMAPIHDRMPVTVEPEDFARWLDPDITEEADLADLLASRPWNDVEVYPVSRYVNSPKNDSRRCIERVQSRGDPSLFSPKTNG